MYTKLNPGSWPRRYRYLLSGVLFGLCFPLVATIWECLRLTGRVSWTSFVELHQENQLLWIIDLAPIVLGFYSWRIGIAVEKVLAEQKKRRLDVEQFVQKLSQQNEELTLLNKSLDDLLYSASHDLKTPAVNMRGLVQMMRMVMGKPEEEEMKYQILDRMEQTSRRMGSLIADLQDITRIEKGEFEISEELPLKETVENIWAALEDDREGREVAIHLDLQEVPTVSFPRSGLESILQNLISNAIRYSSPDRPPEIWVRSKKTSEMIEIQVEDNGQGIDLDQHRNKMFQMFKRFHTSQEGTGIGLYIVKRTLDQLGGSIEVDSEVGEGTRFTFWIPQMNASA